MRGEDRGSVTIMVFALRYSLPRHSCAFSTTSSYIMERIDMFTDRDIQGMIEDCRLFYPSLDFGGEDDRKSVDKFRRKLKEILRERGESHETNK